MLSHFGTFFREKLQHETAENPKDQEAPTIFQNVSSVKKHSNSLMISKRSLIWKRTESEQHARECLINFEVEYILLLVMA
ncbi:unnamed protein product [Rhizophagus irregularis]|nr:unnamed protein product [Rhizophagus irregularis]